MKRRRFILALALLVALVFAVGALILWSREPSYEGKPLSAWLVDMRAAIMAGNYSTNTPAMLAIKNIGTNGLPMLIHILRARDSKPKQLLMKWAPKQKLLTLHLRSADDRRYDAMMGYQALGPLAISQVPALIQLLERDSAPRVRQCTASALGMIGPGASPAGAALIQAARDQDDLVRVSALWALSRILPDPQMTMPVLLTALSDRHQVARENAALALGRYGTLASNAVPALTAAVGTNNAASLALKLISDAAAKAGVE